MLVLLTTKPSSLACVVCVWGALGEELTSTLASLLESSLQPEEVIVVGALTEQWGEAALVAYASRLPLRVELSATVGHPLTHYMRAMELSLSIRQCDWLVFLESGDRLQPEALAGLAGVTEGAALGRVGWLDPRGELVLAPESCAPAAFPLAWRREALAARGPSPLRLELGWLLGPCGRVVTVKVPAAVRRVETDGEAMAVRQLTAG